MVEINAAFTDIMGFGPEELPYSLRAAVVARREGTIPRGTRCSARAASG